MIIRGYLKLLGALAMLTTLVFEGLSPTVCLGGGPENVLLVVNADNPASLLIANHYQAWRGIPSRNVVYLRNVPQRQLTSLDIFRDRILQPIMAEIEQRKLIGQIDTVVYSAGFPTGINIGDHVKQINQNNGNNPPNAGPNRALNPRASINGLTYFALAVMADSPSYLSLQANRYYRDQASKLLTHPFVGDEQSRYDTAISAIRNKDFGSAVEQLEELAAQHPQQVALHFQLARAWAGKQDAPACAAALREAIKNGWSYRQYTRDDPWIGAMSADSDVQAMIAKIPDEPFEFLPTIGFDFDHHWAPNGSVNETPEQGHQYFLSTVLAVTQNLGNSEQEALRQLQQSVAADSSFPQGTFAFTLTGDIRTKSRQPQFAAAIERLQALGHKAEIVSAAMPARGPLVGLSIGAANFKWPAKLELAPGAIAENFTSFGGALERTGQTKLSEFVRRGAAGTSGTVIEPLAIPAKFPHALIHVHYARGCSLAEAYYQSVASPFQLLIVGDPLCRPWASSPAFQVLDWEPDYPLAGNVAFRADDSKSPVPIAGYEIYLDERLIARQANLKRFAFDTRTLPDGYHELRIVAIGNTLLRPTGRQILPFSVDNLGREVKIVDWPQKGASGDQPLTFRVVANWGNRIQLLHNQREIAVAQGQTAVFTVNPQILGRGPVNLMAVASQISPDSSKSEPGIASRPIRLEIQGPISSEIPITEPDLQHRPGAAGDR